MTSEEFPKHFWPRVIELAKVLGAISVIVGFFGGAWSVTYGPARDLLNEWKAIQVDIADLQRRMATVQGEDKVIREKPGMTYVSKPVYEGENIVFNMVAERTRLGENCALQYSIPIFTDRMNVPTPGERRPAMQQLRKVQTILKPGYVPPENLIPGRVSIYIILVYKCDEKEVYDQTSTASFELLKGPRPKP